jgi:DNA-binding CsgD family transcriptional regulator
LHYLLADGPDYRRDGTGRLAIKGAPTIHAEIEPDGLQHLERRAVGEDVRREMLSTMGVEAFADRAGRELLATGETVRKRRVETRGDLTAQEAQIARLARDGLTNPEIGAQLFISPRTVQYHLRKVFLKLGISSRAELDRVLPGDPAASSL